MDTGMRKAVLVVLLCTGFASNVRAEFAVCTDPGDQVSPDIDGSKVVWQDNYYTDSDVLGADISNTASPEGFVVSWYMDVDEASPAVYGDTVAFQTMYDGNWDIHIARMWYSDSNSAWYADLYPVSIPDSEQHKPAVWGSNVIWQRPYVDGPSTDLDTEGAAIPDPCSASAYLVAAWAGTDEKEPDIYKTTVVYQGNYSGKWGIYGRDILDLDGPSEFKIAADSFSDKQFPAIWGSYVVWQDSRNSGDIYAANISTPASPTVFPVCSTSASQASPAISGNIIVWQDNRNGNWDIYGYNLLTKKEFRITSESHDQTLPAISGTTVVWQDNRNDNWDIYGTSLTGEPAARCLSPLPGDINGDCRVTMGDFAAFASNWLECGLDQSALCR